MYIYNTFICPGTFLISHHSPCLSNLRPQKKILTKNTTVLHLNLPVAISPNCFPIPTTWDPTFVFFFGTWWLSHFPTAPPTPSWVPWWVPPRRPDLPWPGVRQSGCAWHRCYTAPYTPRRRKGEGPEPAISCWKLSHWHSNLGLVGWLVFLRRNDGEKRKHVGLVDHHWPRPGWDKEHHEFYICTVFPCWMILMRPTSRKPHETKKWPHIERLFRKKTSYKASVQETIDTDVATIPTSHLQRVSKWPCGCRDLNLNMT